MFRSLDGGENRGGGRGVTPAAVARGNAQGKEGDESGGMNELRSDWGRVILTTDTAGAEKVRGGNVMSKDYFCKE